VRFLWGRKKPEAGDAATATPEPADAADVQDDAPEKASGGLLARLADGLKRSSTRIGDSVVAAFTTRKLDALTLEELEEVLIAADLGVRPASRIAARLAEKKFDKEAEAADVRAAMAEVVAEILAPHERDLDLSGPSPQVVLFVGVNGSGKTTTLGKIAAMVTGQGRSPVLAAGDTFRAAAIEQVQVWGQRAGAPVVARETGADAAGLVFDAYDEAKRQGADVLLVDTAGRLQNKAGLMAELAKIVRALRKQDAAAPHHVLLVLDATVGQNAISQAKAFREIAGVTGLVMTKLDGTAKGGVLVALADEHTDLPIYFIGVGEGVDDLRPFSAQDFAKALAGVEDGRAT
jgi:fused signal recognition particle receptor